MVGGLEVAEVHADEGGRESFSISNAGTPQPRRTERDRMPRMTAIGIHTRTSGETEVWRRST